MVSHYGSLRKRMVEYAIGDDTLRMPQGTAYLIERTQRCYRAFIRPGPVLIIPHLPALYVILGVKSPIWDIYAVERPTDRVRATLIPSLEEKNVDWVMIGEISVDDREDLQLPVTHPELWSYIQENFEHYGRADSRFPYRLYRRKSASGARDPDR